MSRPAGFKISVIIVVAAALYLLGNGRVSLWDRDEPRYAMASRWMASHGDWVVPRIGWGENPTTPRTAKPIFIYWCQAAAMKHLGPTAQAARLPSAIAMILTLILVAVAVHRVAGAQRALWTTLILATSALVIATAKMCVTDAVLLLWMTIAQLCLFRLYIQSRSSTGFLRAVVMWLAIALGGFTKGPVALGIPLTTMIVLAVLDRMQGVGVTGWWKKTRPLVGVLIVAIIVGPWLLMLQQRAPGVLHQMVFHDVVSRMQSGLEGHKGPPGYYLVTVFATFFPWSLLLPMAFAIAWKNRHRPEIRFALAAVIGPWIMMEFVQTKLVHYILPVFGPLAFLVADAAVRCFEGKCNDLTNRAAVLGSIVWGLVMIALSSLPWLAAAHFENLPWSAMTAMSTIGVLSAILVILLFARRRPQPALVTMAVGFILLNGVLFGFYLPRADFLRLAQRIAPLLPAGASARMIGYKEQSLAFYQGGTIDEAADELLIRQSPQDWPEYIVLTRSIFDGLPPQSKAKVEIVGEFSGINYAKSAVITKVLIVRTNTAPGL